MHVGCCHVSRVVVLAMVSLWKLMALHCLGVNLFRCSKWVYRRTISDAAPPQSPLVIEDGQYWLETTVNFPDPLYLVSTCLKCCAALNAMPKRCHTEQVNVNLAHALRSQKRAATGARESQLGVATARVRYTVIFVSMHGPVAAARGWSAAWPPMYKAVQLCTLRAKVER